MLINIHNINGQSKKFGGPELAVGWEPLVQLIILFCAITVVYSIR